MRAIPTELIAAWRSQTSAEALVFSFTHVLTRIFEHQRGLAPLPPLTIGLVSGLPEGYATGWMPVGIEVPAP